MRQVRGLVLSLFEVFVLSIPSRQVWVWGLLRGIVSRFPSRGGLGVGFGSVGEVITLPAMLIYLSDDGRGWRLAFALASIAFSLRYPNSQALFCMILTKDWRPSQKNQIRSDFSGALSVTNSIDWGCLRWDAQLWISSHWESYLMRLQVIYTQALKSPKLFEEKPWIQPKARDIRLSGSNACASANKSWS